MLGRAKQLEDEQEVSHYESFRTIMKVCKASGLNFVLMYDAYINMVMEQLYSNRTMSKSGKFKDEVYYTLSGGDRKCVDKMAEEICLSTILLLLHNNKLHYKSKQELKMTRSKVKITIRAQ